MVSLTLAVACVMAVALSCTRGTPPEPQTITVGEVGTWIWVSSVGGIGGDTTYADSVDYTRQLTFDSEGNYSYLRNGFIESAGTYAVLSTALVADTMPSWVIGYSDDRLPWDVIDDIGPDTIVLKQITADGYSQTYLRAAD